MKTPYSGNKPYKVEEIDQFPYKGFAIYMREKNTDRFIFIQGKPVEIPVPELEFEVAWVAKPGLALDFWPNTSSSFLAGPRAITFLSEFCPKEVQFFDARLHCKDQVVTDYKLVNLTQECDSINEEKSEWAYLEDGSLAWPEKFVFRENGLEGHHFARESKMHPWKICSREFVQEYRRRKLKGLEFREDDSYLLGRESFAKEPKA